MNVRSITPILNVLNVAESFAWFEKIGWKKAWDWGSPPTFGAVCCGQVEIFLCLGAQGSRGGAMPAHPGDDDTGGVWMSWWVESPAAVDAAHAQARQHGLTVTWPDRRAVGAFASSTCDTPTGTRPASAPELLCTPESERHK